MKLAPFFNARLYQPVFLCLAVMIRAFSRKTYDNMGLHRGLSVFPHFHNNNLDHISYFKKMIQCEKVNNLKREIITIWKIRQVLMYIWHSYRGSQKLQRGYYIIQYPLANSLLGEGARKPPQSIKTRKRVVTTSKCRHQL